MTRHLSALPLAALLLLGACSSNSDTTGGLNPPPTQQFEIVGTDMSGYTENVVVTLGGVAATGLAVTVNGDTLTAASGSSFYSGRLTTTVAEGGAVQVRVTDGTLTGIGSGIVPSTPVITDVQHGGVGAPVTINWTSSTSPDSFHVALNYHLPDSSSAGVSRTIAGNARTVTLPTTDIPANGVVYSAEVDAFMHGTFTGDATTTSNMHLRAVGTAVTVTIP